MIGLHEYLAAKKREALAVIARRAASRAEYAAASRPPPPPDIHKAASIGELFGARCAMITNRSMVR